jgi:hypothetical protein
MRRYQIQCAIRVSRKKIYIPMTDTVDIIVINNKARVYHSNYSMMKDYSDINIKFFLA